MENLKKAVEELEKREGELYSVIYEVAAAKVEIIGGEPGGIIAGLIAKSFIRSVAPNMMRKLQRLGIFK